MPDHSNITAALSILNEAANEDLQPHAEALGRLYCRLKGVPAVIPKSYYVEPFLSLFKVAVKIINTCFGLTSRYYR